MIITLGPQASRLRGSAEGELRGMQARRLRSQDGTRAIGDNG